MSKEKQTKQETSENEITADLAPFFDLLAKFDHEDKLKEKSELTSDLLVSAPRKSEMDSNSLN